MRKGDHSILLQPHSSRPGQTEQEKIPPGPLFVFNSGFHIPKTHYVQTIPFYLLFFKCSFLSPASCCFSFHPPQPLQISQTQFTLPLQFCSLDCAHTSIHNFTPQRYFSCFSSTLLSFLIFHFRIVSTFDTFPPTSQSLSHCLSSADLLRIPL